MAYLKIDADEKRTKVDMEGTPLSLMGIIGTAMEECLATVVADIPAPGNRAAAQGFCETLQLRLTRKLGSSEESGKSAVGKDVPPKQENPKAPTAEEVLEMIGKLSITETKRLLDLQMQKMISSMGKGNPPKEPEKEEPDVGYGVVL